MGERAVRYAPEEGAALVDVCPLCLEIARRARLDQGGHAHERRRSSAIASAAAAVWASCSVSAAAARRTRSRRRSRSSAVCPADEVAILEVADLFNASTYRRTVGGIAKSLGEAQASIVALSGDAGEMAVTVAWDLSWYQYRVSPDSGQPVRLERRGHELDELEETLQGMERTRRGRGPTRAGDRADLDRSRRAGATRRLPTISRP